MERLFIGLRDFAIEKVVSPFPRYLRPDGRAIILVRTTDAKNCASRTHSNGQSAIFP